MKWLFTTVVSAVLAYLVSFYGFHIPVYWQGWLFHAGTFGVFFMVVGAIWENAEARGSRAAVAFGACVFIISIVAALAVSMTVGSFVFRWANFRDIGQIKKAEKPLEVADIRHIQIVPVETAKWIGSQCLGQGNLGALFELRDFQLQRYLDKLYWVAPLQFRGYWKWRRSNYLSPGYVLVDAQDRNAEPKLVPGYKMRFTFGAWFGANPYRKLYFNGCSGYCIRELTFEIDESGKPFYVASLTSPTIGFSGGKMAKVAILDPETGKIDFYEVGKTPAWADRVFPKDLAREYANWWGNFVQGWWNALAGQAEVQRITEIPEHVDEAVKVNEEYFQDLSLVYNNLTSNPVWIAGMTSPSSADQSLTGYMTADSITGEMIFYPDGGYGNEVTALHAAEAAPTVSQQKSYHASQAIFYNLYGTKAWVVSVVSQSHITEKVAIVYAKDTRQVAVGDSLAEALDAYKDILATLKVNAVVPSVESKLLTASGKIVSINLLSDAGHIKAFIMLDSAPDRIFEVSRNVSIAVLGSRIGQYVKMRYYDTGEGLLEARGFDNDIVKIRRSSNQIESDVKAETARQKASLDIEKEKAQIEEQLKKLDEKKNDL